MKLQHIDAIRGVAILMFIFGHVGQEIKGLSFLPHLLTSYGQMGVQLFFVASAYTLCLSASNRLGETHPIKKYAIRRFFRIAPVYYLGLLGYFAIAVFLEWHKNGHIVIPENTIYLMLQPMSFFLHGFYAPANNNIVPGGWSIGTEMAFYVLFPSLFYYAKKWTMGSLNQGLLLLLITFIITQLVLILVFYFTGHEVTNNSFLYYNLINQFAVFCVGIGYYLFENKSAFTANWKWDTLCFIALTLLALILWNLGWHNTFSFIPLISAVSFVFLISLFKKNKSLNFNLLAKIGTVSYSMYIIHFALLVFSGLVASKLSDTIDKTILLMVLYGITVAATFLLARVSEKHIEKPFIEMGRKWIRKIK